MQGFTLLELLVALAIFAVMSVMAYSGLDIIIKARLQTDQHATKLAHLQIAFSFIKRDIEQYINRPIRDQYGDKQLTLQGTRSNIALTRAGWHNPMPQSHRARSSLQRVAYLIEDKVLIRSYWWVLDRAQDTRPRKMNLLNEVNELQIRYWDKNLQWHEQWPPSNFLDTFKNNPPSKLKAIEITLTITGWGSLIRLFQVPGRFD
jgi:general secretion pathway protein J